jgi:PadR family transcriptional regulator AphA
LRLTATSYIVLGLLARAGGRATPYALKQMAATSVGNFWSVQHAQLYTEPERLSREGLVEEERESGGRRRRLYTITAAGHQALEEWRATPAGEPGELRDPGLLQLFFGADPRRLAGAQVALHAAKLDEYLSLEDRFGATMPDGERLALQAGIAHEREWVSFWRRVGE